MRRCVFLVCLESCERASPPSLLCQMQQNKGDKMGEEEKKCPPPMPGQCNIPSVALFPGWLGSERLFQAASPLPPHRIRTYETHGSLFWQPRVSKDVSPARRGSISPSTSQPETMACCSDKSKPSAPTLSHCGTLGKSLHLSPPHLCSK